MLLFTFGLALLLSSPAQGEAPAPPPLASEVAPTPASEVAPPPASEVTPAPTVEPPPAAPGAPPAGKGKRAGDTKKPLTEPEGLNGFLIGCLQWGTPCLVWAIAYPAMLVCPPLGCVGCLLPAANGYLATFIGDRFGKNRAAAIWPIVAAYVGAAVAYLSLGVAYFGLVGGAVLIASPGSATPDLLGPGALAAGGIGLGVMALATLAVPITYAFTAEEKHPGDDGSAMPGFMSPGHPPPPETKKGANKPGTAASVAVRAMAF